MQTGIQRHIRVQTREDTIVLALADQFGLDYSTAVRYIINDRQRLIALAGNNHRPADVAHCDPRVMYYCPVGLDLWERWRHLCRTTGREIQSSAALDDFDAHVAACAAERTTYPEIPTFQIIHE